MAYSRWTRDCSLYVFSHVDGGVECCGCLLFCNEDEDTWEPKETRFYNFDTLQQHLDLHEKAGHSFPASLRDRETYWFEEGWQQ